MQVFKISLPGNDVKRSQLQEETLDSRYPVPKINAFGKPPHAGVINVRHGDLFIYPLRGITQVVHSFPHGYNYTPTVIGNYYVKSDAGTPFSGALPVLVSGGAITMGLWLLDADPININLKLLGISNTPPAASATTFRFRFYVMAERGKL